MTDQSRNDLKGLSQLTHAGIAGVTDLVESMHQRIYTLGGLLKPQDLNQTRGLTRLVFQTIRKTTALSMQGVDLALAKFSPLIRLPMTEQRRNLWVSILNGVLGDHLATSDNPLAINMSLHHQGQPISLEQTVDLCSQSKGQPLMLVHGLCMNDQLWQREGHEHGQSLAASQPVMPIYLRYNTGLSIAHNGAQLAAIIQQFTAAMPQNKKLSLLCHSMGGLVARSAMHLAEQQNHTWLGQIDKVVFLGSPHQGAVLEQSGKLLDYLISISPYSAPFAKLTQARSQGIKDLRYGSITASRKVIQLPTTVACYALAGKTENKRKKWPPKWTGDGLVSVDSALGKHPHAEQTIQFKPKHTEVFTGVSHMGLLSDQRVFKALQKILCPD